MPGILFWDVDTQYDFIMPDGKLCIPGAVELLPNLARLTQLAHRHPKQIRILASMCDHEESDPEISSRPDFQETFPSHCLRGSVGSTKVASTELSKVWRVSNRKMAAKCIEQKLERYDGDILIVKQMFDVFSNPNTEAILRHLDPEQIYVYGVALDVCVARVMEGLLHLARTNLFLVRDATEAIDRARGESLVKQWSLSGVNLIRTYEVCQKFDFGVRRLITAFDDLAD
jgi:nicotinamidase/pyrazinamidase